MTSNPANHNLPTLTLNQIGLKFEKNMSTQKSSKFKLTFSEQVQLLVQVLLPPACIEWGDKTYVPALVDDRP